MKLINKRISADSITIKYTFITDDLKIIESCYLFLPSHGDNLCISSQIGCPSKCKLCECGSNPFYRNLLDFEIFGQVLLISKDLKKDISCFEISLMGIGDPLYNWNNILSAMRKFKLSNTRKINLSTIYPQSIDYLDIIEFKGMLHFQFSLHFPSDDKRAELMNNELPNLQQSISEMVYLSKISGDYLCINYTLLNDGM